MTLFAENKRLKEKVAKLMRLLNVYINECPFHINSKRSDMVDKLLEEDYYQPLANGYDEDELNKDELLKWYDTLTNKEMSEILMTDEHYGICWCEEKNGSAIK